MKPSIEALTQEWLRLDQDPSTRGEIETLVADGNTIELEKRLRPRIAFGTAGLRATMGAGFARMNAVTVIQASQGLAAYLLQNETNVEERGIVIGRDARFNSEYFAKLVAAAFMANNIRVNWLDQCHTPLVPFTVSKLNACAGIMVTASHNPAADNGYKVYWSNSCQIIPPHDTGIAQSILDNLEPLMWDTSRVSYENVLMTDALQVSQESYFKAVEDAARISTSLSPLTFVYTPMHGVGLPFFDTVLKRLGLDKDMHVVHAQAHPDPTFPTVRFPNPEEEGALDLAKQTAEFKGLSLILANDPDADRFAVAEKVNNTWRQLTGNQLGVLLASHMLETHRPKRQEKGLAMLASTVSSRMLAKMAAVEGFHFEETLTGFKWLGNRARDLQKAGYDALYAYEEAIGYMFSDVVFDKDGVAAGAVFLAACHRWSSEGLTPWSKYEQLCKRYGYFEEANTYLTTPSADVTNSVFSDIRASKPSQVGPRRILRWRDLTTGYDSGTPDRNPLLPVDTGSQMISCELEGDVQFTVRGSGTESKAKIYVEGSAGNAEDAKNAAMAVLDDLIREWFRPEQNGLVLA